MSEEVWQRRVTPLGTGRRLCRVQREDEPLSNRAVLHALANDASFRRCLGAWLAEEPFTAFFWELPPLAEERWDEPFEYVVSDAPALARVVADPTPFQNRFATAEADGIAEFTNLGGDAVLLAPEPRGEPRHYAHLAAFVRGAPEAQRDALFARIGRAALAQVSARPLWISTSGLGVYWLHLRFDRAPKYYQYAPYKRWPCV